jgi:hypothetical protein
MRVTVKLNKWKDRVHYTVFDADPDYQSSQVEGVLVPYCSSEWPTRDRGHLPLTNADAVRHALLDLIDRFPVPHTPDIEVVLPLPFLAAWALQTEFDRFPSFLGGVPEAAPEP